MPESEGHTLFTVLEAAAYLNVSRTKIYRLIEGGRLNYIENPLDRRERLIEKSALDVIKQIANRKKEAGRAALESEGGNDGH